MEDISIKQTIIVPANVEQIFRYPCILEVSKMHVEDTEPHPFATLDCSQCIWYKQFCDRWHMTDDCDEAYPGDKLIEYSNGKWLIEKKKNCR